MCTVYLSTVDIIVSFGARRHEEKHGRPGRDRIRECAYSSTDVCRGAHECMGGRIGHLERCVRARSIRTDPNLTTVGLSSLALVW